MHDRREARDARVAVAVGEQLRGPPLQHLVVFYPQVASHKEASLFLCPRKGRQFIWNLRGGFLLLGDREQSAVNGRFGAVRGRM